MDGIDNELPGSSKEVMSSIHFHNIIGDNVTIPSSQQRQSEKLTCTVSLFLIHPTVYGFGCCSMVSTNLCVYGSRNVKFFGSNRIVDDPHPDRSHHLGHHHSQRQIQLCNCILCTIGLPSIWDKCLICVPYLHICSTSRYLVLSHMDCCVIHDNQFPPQPWDPCP